jgi:MATE family multidrug resistance protein
MKMETIDNNRFSTLANPTESSSLLKTSQKNRWATTVQAEMTRLGKDAILLVAANMLQFALNLSTILVISPLGTIELGAASVATTTANITGFIVFQGLSTSLDTLCAQAWGSGDLHLIKVHVQRMIVLLGLAGVLVATFWLLVGRIFEFVIPDTQTAMYAALYLRTLICAIPGYVIFEAGKRTLTAKGTFLPITIAMCAGVLANLSFSWLLVWVRPISGYALCNKR